MYWNKTEVAVTSICGAWLTLTWDVLKSTVADNCNESPADD